MVELLSPAGDMNSLKAAVLNGADAVYLGLTDFSARAHAQNFTFSQLEHAVTYCRQRCVKVYLALNTLIDEHDVGKAVSDAYNAYNMGIDALITADMVLAHILSNNLPKLDLHASTQMSVITPEQAGVLKQAGFKRVIAAREATMKQIEDLVKSGIEVEVFAHGALCVSFSGQCLLSYFNGGKSGNKGTCAQPCRLPYTLYSDKDFPVTKNFLSTKDISVLDEVNIIKKAGVTSLKIEGRMKSPEYVAIVTDAYKKALSNELTDEHKRNVLMAFNREGFSGSYMFENPGKNMMALTSSKNTGIRIGKVVKSDKKKNTVTIESNVDLVNGDGIGFAKSDSGTYVDILRKKDNSYTLLYKNPVIDNEPVYLTYDKRLMKKASGSFIDDFKRKTKITGIFSVKPGESASLTVCDKSGHCVTSHTDMPAQKAINESADNDIKESLNKTGNSLFEFEDIAINTDVPVFFPRKTINELRRDAFDKLTDIYVTPKQKERLPERLNYTNISINTSKVERPGVSIFFFEDRPDVDISSLDVQRIYLSEPMYERNKKDDRVYVYIPTSARSMKYQNEYPKIISSSAKILAFDAHKVFDFGINCLNTYTVDFLSGYKNVDAIALSHELKIDDLHRFIGINGDTGFEYIGYGRTAVMKSVYCIKGAFNEKPACSTKEIHLVDRMGKQMDVVTYCNDCVSYILGAFTINNLAHKEFIRESGVDTIRLNIYDETPEKIYELIERAK